jgi:hypothetical protein
MSRTRFERIGAVIRHGLFCMLEVVDGLGRCWFLLLSTLLVAFLMALVPQGREALWATGAWGREWHVRAFFATSLSGTVLMMLFAASILEHGKPRDESRSNLQDYVRYTVPGIIGMISAFLVPVLIQMQVAGNTWLLPQRREELRELGILFQRLVVPVICIARCPAILKCIAMPWKANRRQRIGVVALIVFGLISLSLSTIRFEIAVLVLMAGLILVDIIWWPTGLEPAAVRWRNKAGLYLAAGWILAGCWLALRPETRAETIGPATLILFAQSFWMSIAFRLYYLIGRWLSQGVSVILTILGLIAFLSGPFNLRLVRLLNPAVQARPAEQKELSKHIDAWLMARKAKIEAARGQYPVFVASAEGGGIRAACWTSGLLSAIQDDQPEFADHLLGISGVSGGSLGAATFVCLMHEARSGKLDLSGPNTETGPLERYSDEILGRDFLSPVLATMLIPDVAACLFHFEGAKDRAAVLEKSFEIAWRNAIRTGTFEGPLHALWASEGEPLLPALFLNSTEADTGQRIVNSHVTIDPEISPALALPTVIPAHEMRVSTAVLLSARFPVISPVASLRDSARSNDLHIVDGGYADNSGTLTASEVVTALMESATRLGLKDKIRPVGIVITDNPIVLGETSEDADRAHRESIERTAAGAVLAPFETMDKIRQSLSDKHRTAYDKFVKDAGGEILDGFALQASRIEFPLGWMLSRGTRTALTDQIRSLKQDPAGDFRRIRTLIEDSHPKPVSNPK